MATSVAIIGGGAAGFFTAINLAEQSENAEITIYEGSNKLLSKVLVSGGGRCNLTNKINDPEELSNNYPRGKEFVKHLFTKFSSNNTQQWFQERGVPLKTEDDGRVFPISNSSQSIYDVFLNLARKHNIEIKKNHRLSEISFSNMKWKLEFGDLSEESDYLVLATGPSTKIHHLLSKQGIAIVPPLPSLFTFHSKNHPLVELAGLSVTNSKVTIKEISNSISSGPLLITHHGYSAPSILKLSAWHARELAQKNYNFTLQINWDNYDPAELQSIFKDFSLSQPKAKVKAWKQHNLPKRLWNHLFLEAKLQEYTNWSEIGKKGITRLISVLSKYDVVITKKSTHIEEFVTAGGIDLAELENENCKIKNLPKLYAVGELLNIDAITGGFNFQAAWSGAYAASSSIARDLNST